MNINDAKNLLNEKFNDFHIFNVIANPDDEYPEFTFLITIAHDNMQKDVWFKHNGIDTVIEVPYEHMGTDEQTRWLEYTNKSQE